jgi:hypothetical protein
MTETAQPARRLVKVQEFIDFLLEKKVSAVCISCGGDTSFVSSDSDPSYAAQTIMEIAEFSPGKLDIKAGSGSVILALSAICGNCGYIRSYATHNVYEWLDRRQKNEQESNDQHS